MPQTTTEPRTGREMAEALARFDAERVERGGTVFVFPIGGGWSDEVTLTYSHKDREYIVRVGWQGEDRCARWSDVLAYLGLSPEN